MGCAEQLSSSSAIRKQLAKADVLGLTEMGLNREQIKSFEIPGFTCIKALARPHDPKHGGVAVLVKHKLASSASVCAEHEDLGIVWLKLVVTKEPNIIPRAPGLRVPGLQRGHTTPSHIAARPVFIAFCYLPHKNSAVHKRNERSGTESVDEHFAMLDSDIMRFSAEGDVVLMGDFNARIGNEIESTDDGELEGMNLSGVAVPTPILQFSRLMNTLGKRASRDKSSPNALGRRVLNLCANHQLMVLNGRLLGDEHGAFTFFSRTGQGSSVIDLVIATPALVVNEDTGYREGCMLEVTSKENCPLRLKGEPFDHMPVFFTFTRGQDLQIISTSPIGDTEPTKALKWHDSLQDFWVEALMHDTSVQLAIDAMAALDNESPDGVLMDKRFGDVMAAALAALDDKCGGKLLKPKKCSNRKRVHKPWFDDECRRMRKELRQVEWVYGEGSDEVLVARRAYWSCVRSAKRRSEYARMLRMGEQINAQPKSFWDIYKDVGTRPNGPDDMHQWTAYFENILSAIGKSEYVGGTPESHCLHHAELFGLPSQEALQAAECLNAPVTHAEVGRVLNLLANHKSPGVDGVSAEFYKHAYYLDEEGRKVNILIPLLKRVFDAVLRGGYPPEWAVAALVPVPKPKADHSTCDGFRGIAVGLVLGKMYSMLLLGRMDAWAERQQLRARGQAGFRSGRSTVDNVFVLRHVINKYKADKKPVYVAFIDFKKAYDCVDRELLWRCLAKLGVHGATMNTLREMHEDVQMRVRLNGHLGTGFQAGRGVRQGDPLSPLLFGLFIDRFESFLAARSEGGVLMGNTLLQLLLYADDLALLAESKEQLQIMLDVLGDFCRATCMIVNVVKSEVVVFNVKKTAVSFTYNGDTMPVKDHFVYLGVRLDANHVVGSVMDMRLKKARAAMYAMFRRCYELGLHNVYMQGRLFDTLVQPVLNYGCEVWAAEQLSGAKAVHGEGTAELLHFAFLRQSLGVRKSTSHAVMLTETGRGFMNQSWLRQCLNFHNRIMIRNSGDLARLAMAEDVSLTRTGSKYTWSHHIATCMRRLPGGGDTANQFLDDAICDTPMVVAAFAQAQMQHAWGRCPAQGVAVRDIADDDHVGFKKAVYQRWFQTENGKLPGYVYDLYNRDNIKAVARLRMGSHSLGVEKGRWNVMDGKRKCVPRSMRLCKLCTAGARDDEVHVLTCPAYWDLRQKHFGRCDCFDAVSDDQSVQQTMNSNAWLKLSRYVLDVNAYRTNFELTMNSSWNI